jgi:hypothetical protein
VSRFDADYIAALVLVALVLGVGLAIVSVL